MSAEATYAGRILVAVSSLKDPNFHRTVLLMCEHGPEGALGLVLNRKHPLNLGDALRRLESPVAAALPLREGGPVQPEVLFFLHDSDAVGGQEVLPGLRLSGDEEALGRLIEELEGESPPRCHVFSGYSGWGPGQLEQELGQNAWVVTDADPALVFEDNEEELWGKVLRGLGGRWGIMGRTPRDPDLN